LLLRQKRFGLGFSAQAINIALLTEPQSSLLQSNNSISNLASETLQKLIRAPN
jgi:hypothetical protein